MAAHIALLGDSIFDNAKCTHGLPDVVGHLRSIVSIGTKASLLTVDGSNTGDVVEKQSPRLPADVTLRVAFEWRLPVIDLRRVVVDAGGLRKPS